MTGWSAKYHRESYYGVINGRTLLLVVYRHQTHSLPRSLWLEPSSLWLYVSVITWSDCPDFIGQDTPVTACNWGRLGFVLSRALSLLFFSRVIQCAWAVFTLVLLHWAQPTCTFAFRFNLCCCVSRILRCIILNTPSVPLTYLYKCNLSLRMVSLTGYPIILHFLR